MGDWREKLHREYIERTRHEEQAKREKDRCEVEEFIRTRPPIPDWVKNARRVTGGTTRDACAAVQAKRIGMNIRGQSVAFYRERPCSMWELYADGSVVHADEIDCYLLKVPEEIVHAITG